MTDPRRAGFTDIKVLDTAPDPRGTFGQPGARRSLSPAEQEPPA